ncbi:MAG: serine/threonine-protein phosphatase [Actinomycetota bacterium]|nr:serine/threonine-protein phosphatase [Actinomycetota bacterium]
MSEQIKRLVRTEHELYQFQEQLDDQIRIYRHLYEVGKKLNATLDLAEILRFAIEFALYQLNFERCVALLYDAGTRAFHVGGHDGYYDEASQRRLTGLRFSADDPRIAPIMVGSEQVICAQGCDRHELLALGQVLEMGEYVAFPLGGEPQQLIGLLIVGNTQNNSTSHTHIQADSEFVVGLANLASQIATAIRMRREIQDRERRLKQEARVRERIEQELHVARRIQQASLPEVVPDLEGWEISPRYRPAREVGGDFFDFLELEDGRLGLVVGDATGKGVPAALVMSTTLGMLRAVAQSCESPGEVLLRVNEALCSRIPDNMFVTCFYATLEPERGTFAYANAGHDLPYVQRGGDAEELMARGMPLGLMPGMPYEEKQTILQAGEGVLFYSDGLVEAHNPEGEMFGFPRLRALVAEHEEGEALVEFLMEELHSFVGEGWEQEDDITLLMLQRATR